MDERHFTGFTGEFLRLNTARVALFRSGKERCQNYQEVARQSCSHILLFNIHDVRISIDTYDGVGCAACALRRVEVGRAFQPRGHGDL